MTSAAEKHAAALPFWPEGMSRVLALAFTGVGDAQMAAWEKSGRVRFLPRGPKGAMVARKVDLQAALDDLFSSTAAEDMDFG